MRKKSLIKFSVIIFLLLLLSSGCSHEEKDVVQTNFDDQKKYLSMSNGAESDDGIYYIQRETDSEVLKYIDKKTAKETVLCPKLNCKHNSKECPAVCGEGEFMSSLAYSNGTLYYMVLNLNEEPDALEFYRMNQNGTEKELLHKFENQYTIPNGAGLYKGKVFLSMPTMKQFEDGTGEISAEPSLIMYDLDSGKETLILDGTEEKGKFVIPCGGSEEGIYFWEIGFEKDQGCIFKQYDFADGRINAVLEAEERDIQLIRDDIIYVQPETGGVLQSYHVKSMEYQDVLEWTDEVSAVYVQDGYIELVKETAENGKKQFAHRWYDLKTGKYLFDGYQNSEGIRVIRRLEEGYWIEKAGENCLYDPDSGEWKKIEEIR